MRTQIKLQTPEPLHQLSQTVVFRTPIGINREEITPAHRYDATITMILSPEKNFKTRTFILINGSQPEVVDNQGIRWSQAFCKEDGTLFVDLGEKIH